MPVQGRRRAPRKADLPPPIPEVQAALTPEALAEAQRLQFSAILERVRLARERGWSLTAKDVQALEALRRTVGGAAAEGEARVAGQALLARIWAVSERTVRNWQGAGCPRPEVALPGSIADALAAVERWREEERARAERARAPEREDRLRSAKARKAELEVRKIEGRLLDADEVEAGRLARVLDAKRTLLAAARDIEDAHGRAVGAKVREAAEAALRRLAAEEGKDNG